MLPVLHLPLISEWPCSGGEAQQPQAFPKSIGDQLTTSKRPFMGAGTPRLSPHTAASSISNEQRRSTNSKQAALHRCWDDKGVPRKALLANTCLQRPIQPATAHQPATPATLQCLHRTRLERPQQPYTLMSWLLYAACRKRRMPPGTRPGRPACVHRSMGSGVSSGGRGRCWRRRRRAPPPRPAPAGTAAPGPICTGQAAAPRTCPLRWA